ncbi:MAG: LrgB family protein [Clostridiaceae bacterium]|nr:LrgB family protein [Clostridiaceae bacterium]
MKDVICGSVFFGAVLSILAFEIGRLIKKRFPLPLLNPLLIAIVLLIVVLRTFDIDYDTYYNGAKYISYLLTPATVCLAVPLYQQFEILQRNWKAIAAGVLSGVLASLGGVYVLSRLFGLTHEQYVTLLPKSITTAIGMSVSAELGGITAITVAVIIMTGILGNVLAETVCRLFRIEEPVAKGIAIGTASHAIGTAKAMEIGETEGTMSGLAISVAGLITVVFASFFANWI